MLENGFYNLDCMQALKDFPDNHFDLAIVDPPYGGGANEDAKDTFNGAVVGRFGGWFEKYFPEIKSGVVGGGRREKYGKQMKNWDIAPDEDYFKELFRVSKNQIIWGGATTLDYHRQDAS